MKYEIIKPLSCDWNVFGNILQEVKYEHFKIKNRVIQLYYDYTNMQSIYKAQNGVYPKDRDIYGSPYATYVYRTIVPEFPVSITTNITSVIQKATKLWSSSRTDILRGNKSIPSFRRNGPIELNGESIRKVKYPEDENSNYKNKRYVQLDLALVSKGGVNVLKEKFKNAVKDGKNKKSKKYTDEQLEKITTSYTILIDGGKKSAKAIIDRVISGDYSVKGSSIVYNSEKRKWMLTLVYQMEKADNEELNPDRVMGIDMGVVNAVYMAVNDDDWWRDRIEGGEIQQKRFQLESQKQKLQRASKIVGKSKIGHGYYKRTQRVNRKSKKISNMRETINHKYSRYIVDKALALGCGTIQMEDLSGISEYDRFLKNWTYYDLQQKITYKAAEHGIKVIKTDPHFTSQRCSKCGYIDEANRDKTQGQGKFECVKCGYKTHADHNAARNISIPYIDQIIKEERSMYI